MYVYNDEDNAPMNNEAFEVHNPTVYTGVYEARMMDKHGEPEPAEKPANGCWNCMNFDWNHEACTINWNNMDESLYNPNSDDRELTDWCGDWEEDSDADYDEIFGED
jgi:hypothetical protein